MRKKRDDFTISKVAFRSLHIYLYAHADMRLDFDLNGILCIQSGLGSICPEFRLSVVFYLYLMRKMRDEFQLL